MAGLTDALFDTASEAAASANDAPDVVLARAVADTIAVAAAGFCAPHTARISSAYKPADEGSLQSWDGCSRASNEASAIVNGAAAHALDFDDLDLASSAHLGAVVLPTLLSDEAWPDEASLFRGMRGGIAAAAFLAQYFGPNHYGLGWHPTSTIGALAATVAKAIATEVPRRTFRSAIGICGTQVSGQQANFGSSAKSLHAGFAAASALRSVRLASFGVSAAEDILSASSFRKTFAIAGSAGEVGIDTSSLAKPLPKLFPCCFASHRAILAALAARSELGDRLKHPDVRIEVQIPQSQLDVVAFTRPESSTEAAFSLTYCVAAALIDGNVELRHFYEELAREDILDLESRIIGIGSDEGGFSDLLVGEAQVRVTTGLPAQAFVQTAMPSSFDAGPGESLLQTKITNCLHRYEAAFQREFPILSRLRSYPTVAPWLEN